MKSDNQFLATNCWQTVQDNPFSFQRSVDVALVNCSGNLFFSGPDNLELPRTVFMRQAPLNHSVPWRFYFQEYDHGQTFTG